MYSRLIILLATFRVLQDLVGIYLFFLTDNALFSFEQGHFLGYGYDTWYFVEDLRYDHAYRPAKLHTFGMKFTPKKSSRIFDCFTHHARISENRRFSCIFWLLFPHSSKILHNILNY